MSEELVATVYCEYCRLMRAKIVSSNGGGLGVTHNSTEPESMTGVKNCPVCGTTLTVSRVEQMLAVPLEIPRIVPMLSEAAIMRNYLRIYAQFEAAAKGVETLAIPDDFATVAGCTTDDLRQIEKIASEPLERI